MKDTVTHVDGVCKPLSLHVVEGELVPDGGIGLVTEPPCRLVVVGSVFVARLLLHDEAHVLVGLSGTLIVVEDLPQELARHVVLASLDVDVSQQQPAPLQLLSILKVPAVLGYTLQLVPNGKHFNKDALRGILQCNGNVTLLSESV